MRMFGWAAVAILLGFAASDLAAAAEPRSPITISSDTLEVSRKSRVAVYRGNVSAVDHGRGLSILAEKIEFLFDERMEELERAVAEGNVRITYGERRGASQRAEYTPQDARVVLLGHPKVWQESDVVTGCKIILLLREDRSVVEGCQGERVNMVLYPKKTETPSPSGPRR